MIGVYGVVMAVILLFPWLLVSAIGIGSMWATVSSIARDRRERERSRECTMPQGVGRLFLDASSRVIAAGNRLDMAPPLG